MDSIVGLGFDRFRQNPLKFDLKCHGVGTTLMLTSLLENIELNLYAPLSPTNQMQEVYEKASEVISLLDKQVY